MKKLYIVTGFVLFYINTVAQSLSLLPADITTIADGSASSILKQNSNVIIRQIGVTSVAGTYVQINNGNAGLTLNSTANDAITIESTTDITSFTLTYAANITANTANPYVGYSPTISAPGSTSVAVASCEMNATGITGTTQTLVTYTVPAGTRFIVLVKSKACTPIVANTTNVRISQIDVGYVPSPVITTSVNTLSGFVQSNAMPSTSQSYTVSSIALTGTTVDVTAPTSFQISEDNVAWTNTLSLPVSGGIITGQPKIIYTRLNDLTATAATYTGNITHINASASTVNVALNGTTVTTPTLIATPTNLSFGNAIVSAYTTTQSYNLFGTLLTPANDNVTITAPTGYEVSLSPTAGFATTILVPYTMGSLPTTPIYVRLLPTAVATYNGNILNDGGGATAINIAVTGAGVLQQVGDFGAVVNGLWSAPTTWRTWDGTAFAAVTATTPGINDNVWITAGVVVSLDQSNRNIKNLVVDGTLTSTNLVSNVNQFKINGNLIQVNSGGFIGNPTQPTGDLSDGLSIDLISPSLTINGSGGTIAISRMRTNANNTVVNLNHDMMLNYHGQTNQGGHTAAYFMNAGDNSVLNIAAGKALTLAPWAVLATTVTTNGLPNVNMTVNVNGTLLLQKTPAPNTQQDPAYNSFIYGGTTSPGVFRLNINNGGIVTTPEFYPNGLVSGDATPIGNDAIINVATGGILNIDSAVDLRKASQIIMGGGAVNFGPQCLLRIGNTAGIATIGSSGAIQTTSRSFPTDGYYEYAGAAAQISGNGLPATVGTLQIKNAAGLTLTSSVTAADSIRLTTGKITLGNQSIATPKVKNGSSNSYIVTNGSGTFDLIIPAATATYALPIGTTSAYRPATITFTTAPSAGVLSAKTIVGDPNLNGLPVSESGIAFPDDNILLTAFNYWEINSTATGGTYNITVNGNGQGGILDYTKTTMLKRPNTASNWVLEGTYAVPTGSNAAPVVTRTGLTSFSQFVIAGGTNAILPATIVQFTLSYSGNAAQLQWKTANEINVQKFVIQKSIDGINFTTLGEVTARNGIVNNYYNYADNSILLGKVYYRLKTVDFNGRYSFSQIVSLNAKQVSNIQVYPNPTSTVVTITLPKLNKATTLHIVDAKGTIVKSLMVAANTIQASVYVGNLTSGVYYLQQNETKKKTVSFVKN
jgi:hypothetical protein